MRKRTLGAACCWSELCGCILPAGCPRRVSPHLSVIHYKRFDFVYMKMLLNVTLVWFCFVLCCGVDVSVLLVGLIGLVCVCV